MLSANLARKQTPMIVKYVKNWLIDQATILIQLSVVMIFVVGVFAFPLILLAFGLPVFLILPLYGVFLYYWFNRLLPRAQDFSEYLIKKTVRWIKDN